MVRAIKWVDPGPQPLRRSIFSPLSLTPTFSTALATYVPPLPPPSQPQGWLPNLVKNMPNSSIRLTTFDACKDLIGRAGQAEARAEAKALAAKAKENKGRKGKKSN